MSIVLATKAITKDITIIDRPGHKLPVEPIFGARNSITICKTVSGLSSNVSVRPCLTGKLATHRFPLVIHNVQFSQVIQSNEKREI